MRTFVVFTVALVASLAQANPVENGNQAEVGLETAQQAKQDVINGIRQATDVALAALQKGEINEAQFHEIVKQLKKRLEEELGEDRNLPQDLENIPESVKNNARRAALQAFEKGLINIEELKEVLQALAPAFGPVGRK